MSVKKLFFSQYSNQTKDVSLHHAVLSSTNNSIKYIEVCSYNVINGGVK